jgi:hypothetical protein
VVSALPAVGHVSKRVIEASVASATGGDSASCDQTGLHVLRCDVFGDVHGSTSDWSYRVSWHGGRCWSGVRLRGEAPLQRDECVTLADQLAEHGARVLYALAAYALACLALLARAVVRATGRRAA